MGADPSDESESRFRETRVRMDAALERLAAATERLRASGERFRAARARTEAADLRRSAALERSLAHQARRQDQGGPEDGGVETLDRGDQRERAADERERVADDRELVADQRERTADERERAADERERYADQRETAAGQRELRVEEREVVAGTSRPGARLDPQVVAEQDEKRRYLLEVSRQLRLEMAMAADRVAETANSLAAGLDDAAAAQRQGHQAPPGGTGPGDSEDEPERRGAPPQAGPGVPAS